MSSDIPHAPNQPCCVCSDASWCECGGCSECRSVIDRTYSGLREPVGEMPDDGAIEEIVKELEKRDCCETGGLDS